MIIFKMVSEPVEDTRDKAKVTSTGSVTRQDRLSDRTKQAQ